MRRISVLIADDHAVVRAGFVALLRPQADLEVVAEASNGEEALRLIETHRPDVALLDISMPQMTGIEVARAIRDAGLRTATILLSMYMEPGVVRAALDAGVSGYLLKECEASELLHAIRASAAGETYLSPKVATVAVEALRSQGGAPAIALTPRERDILRLLARGLISKEIASELQISKRTVDWHRTEIMGKLQISHVPGLVKYALKHQLARLEE